jgi:heat shock factor-binding protein 1
VDELLNSLSNKFAGVSSEIFAKSMCSPDSCVTKWLIASIVDEMSRRLDKLETTLQSSSSDGKDGKPNPSIG